MKNLDNKTIEMKNFDVNLLKKQIENFPCHIATVSGDFPNLAVASDIKVIAGGDFNLL